ncbi:Mdm33 family-domain-containing protein [Rhypophila decipiens]|uniref:Sensitive to high expression protein 9, mitochondrial n=1 Tax=Rhypophila decipiens TaxID=261697 RepID=A0AAN7B2J3_9PEZI|nr:Mdm33 family-domain-containing protein [Rhypophila decipiens]
MSTHTALRLAVRGPLRGPILPFDLFATAPLLSRSRLSPGLFQRLSTTTRSSKFKPSICLQCSFRGRSRAFSTIPPSDSAKNTVNTANTETETTLQQSEQLQDDISKSSQDQDTRPIEGKPESESDAAQTPPDEPANSLPPPDQGPELPSSTEDRRHPLSARFSTFMDDLQSRMLNATQTINDLTGYSAIEAIKAKNVQLEADLAAAQARLRAARQGYKSLTLHRAATQRELTTLLARKDSWNHDTDVDRFTKLYRLDHELEAQVAAASVELTEAETEESKVSADLNAGIMKRYHEEQIWSDRIRRQSTWGTWGLMGVNILLFLVLQFVAEPWRRKRLMRHIEANEKIVMDDVKRELAEVKAALEASGLREHQQQRRVADEEEAAAAAAAAALAAVHEAAEKIATEAAVEELTEESKTTQTQEQQPGVPWQESWKSTLSDPELLKAAVSDLYSERRIDFTMRDASLLALEGAVAGAALVGGVALLLLRGGSR